MEQIRNVYCVGRNYRLHADELGNTVPNSPMIFMKPTHAVVPMNGNTISLPGKLGVIHYEAELVVRIKETYRAGMKASDLIDAFALGIDFTLREVQEKLKEKQHPWLKAKGFLSSAPITSFNRIEDINELAAEEFSFQLNGVEKQRGHIQEMIYNIQTLVDSIGPHYGISQGDIIFTGTPAGVGQISHNDTMELYWGNQLFGKCLIKILMK
jgi:fumarylpyruvate hydrolase